ncbi:MAG TPA: hypothetical protein VML55_16595 [Planctomycetaceae bacterium]|nr:hypothetical protein [Planctomycetaceae bacterium]
MRECPHCGRRASALDRCCSTCSTPLETPDPDDARRDDFLDESAAALDVDESDLTPVARFLNAAEAGYFAHELRFAERLPVLISAEESFDAVAGYWTTRFLLCVPQAVALRAAEALERLVAESESDDAVAPRPSAAAGDEPLPAGRQASDVFDPRQQTRADVAEPVGVGWVPLVLTLAASSAVFWNVRRPAEAPRPPAAPVKRHDADEWERHRAPTRPWMIPHENAHRP